MATISGQVNVSGYGPRVPVRVERRDGSLVAVSTAERDGSYQFPDIEPGDYVVVERGVDRKEISTDVAPNRRRMNRETASARAAARDAAARGAS